MKNNYSYFQNKDCEYFPCHKCDAKYFNCLFCYCPLYALGDECGGNFSYTQDGIKDCSSCTLPHGKKGYEYIVSNFPRVCKIAEQNRKKHKADKKKEELV